jgi:ABC-type dipeptide/oligopeptide/nickel transport system ATPase component
MRSKEALLKVEELTVAYGYASNRSPIIQNVSFQLFSGEIAAIVGQSGCGKSITAQAIVGLLEADFHVLEGKILYKNENILNYGEKKWQKLRQNEIALLIQHSLNGLNPIQTVKKQMVETIKQQRIGQRKDMKQYIYFLLEQVGFKDPEQVLSSYPFELSGGMRQRILLAMMISLRPKILIADEPTTALDVITRDKVLTLLKNLQQDFDLTVLLISHDQLSVSKIADRIIEMEVGGIVRESASIK